jgi:hypothetical protein
VLADYFGLCDVADSQNPSKDGRFIRLCPKFCFNMRVDSTWGMLLTSQDPVDQTRRTPILDWKQAQVNVDVDVDVVESFSHAGSRAVLAGKEVRGEGSTDGSIMQLS